MNVKAKAKLIKIACLLLKHIFVKCVDLNKSKEEDTRPHKATEVGFKMDF